MDLLSVNNVKVHDFTKYTVKRQDLDGEDTTRSETGVLSRERIRAGVYTIEVGVSFYTDADMSALVSVLSNELLSVSFFFGGTKTIEAYSSNQTINLQAAPDGTPYWDISFNLIEY